MERRLLLILAVVFLGCSCALFSEKTGTEPVQESTPNVTWVEETVIIEGNETFSYESPEEVVPEEPEGPVCDECDDNNPCTLDYCNEETGYVCINRKLEGPQQGCEGRSMEGACYEFMCVNGVCYQKVTSECCGNGKCEINSGENYDNCRMDCPKYDYEGDVDSGEWNEINNKW